MSRKPPDCCRFNYVVSKTPQKHMIGGMELPEDHALVSLLLSAEGFRKNPVETVGSAHFNPAGDRIKHQTRFPIDCYPPQERLDAMLEAASKMVREKFTA